MKISLKTKISLPDPIQSGMHLVLPTNGQSGICASFYSPDELDTKAIQYAKELVDSKNTNTSLLRAMDLGCSSYFPQAIRFASLGMKVDAFDREPPIQEYKEINSELNNKVNYVQTDLSKPMECHIDQYQIIYSNRFLSHIPYLSAKALISRVFQNSRSGARFFLSFGTLDSIEAEGYPDFDKPIEERFATQQIFLSKQHQLLNKVCLYNRADLYDKFLVNFNVKILDELAGSASIKLIFEKI